ncbi:conserved hypothetical membrane protein (DUF2254) [Formosa agariphila KMM 3901]|uniref:Conserved hypothetical membrane protein (DUF2254) n=1 Tax=Formosa agariphila (strain DSM 15362 / KCTC 12365 / LMG 23005 / KMM 3901 / M-2Alg 35-1) TaxID=1347342 RepID=T2KN77_FORAG|nr:DUF2254 domain-containing protein [Formosa agariphila]CDF79444.1 conserved hypothetical membrane protein (DUF2254) [Formosa agariphila KMM 3901]
MKKIIFFLKKLKSTFWFIPVLIILITILISIGLVSLDQVISLPKEGLARFFFVNSADSARSILSTISGAMIGVAGTVFSITLVALTLASTQFGPRLIRNFMYVRLNQVVLGSYVSTYLYCLFVLNAIKETDGYTFMPSLSILVAIIAAFVNIILLIVFIHQIATSIQADKVISDISAIISKQFKTLYPEKMGDELDDKYTINADFIKSKYKIKKSIKSNTNGYAQYIDNEALLETISELNGLLVLDFKPGDHMVEGLEIGQLFTNETISEEQLEDITDQFVFGKTKNAQQDLEFSILQMVEIASRALSPGVNDPFTAITCIDNLTATMCRLSQVTFPSNYRLDDDNHLRIITENLTFEDFLDSSFNQIRQYSAGCTSVILKLMDALITIDKFAKKEAHKHAINKHAKMIINVGKASLNEENDLNLLLERSKNIIP